MTLGQSKGTQQVTSGEMPLWDILRGFVFRCEGRALVPEHDKAHEA